MLVFLTLLFRYSGINAMSVAVSLLVHASTATSARTSICALDVIHLENSQKGKQPAVYPFFMGLLRQGFVLIED